MYKEYWKMRSEPFENRCDGEFYYPADSHQAALLKLRYSIENRRAATLVCGPPGVGKSILTDLLRRQLADNFGPICQLVFPLLQPDQLLRYLADQFDPDGAGDDHGAATSIARLERILVPNLQSNRHAVVIIDEAHLLEQNGLVEPLRLLLNLAAEKSSGESAWTMVLVGQHTLLSHVERYPALDQRLAVKCLISRFQPDETNSYIQHRIRAAGASSDQIFTTEAIDAIHHLSQGIPRKINRLCDLALMVGYAEDLPCIDAKTIENVQNELAVPSLG